MGQKVDYKIFLKLNFLVSFSFLNLLVWILVPHRRRHLVQRDFNLVERVLVSLPKGLGTWLVIYD